MAVGDRGRRGGGNRNRDGGLGRDEQGTSLAIEDRHDNLSPIEQRLWMRNHEQSIDAATTAPAASARTYTLPDVGSFIPLPEQSWGAQAKLIRDERNELAFDPSRLFDGIVAEKSGVRGLYDPNSRDYAKYEGLRTNLAVLRNTLLSNGMDAAHIQTVAVALGEAFANDSWWKRLFTRPLSIGVANVEGVGASEMYKYLLEVQDKPAPLQGLRKIINSLIGVPDRNWGLPPLAATPFSPSSLAAPFPDYQTTDISAPQQSFVDRYLNSNATQLSNNIAYGK